MFYFKSSVMDFTFFLHASQIISAGYSNDYMFLLFSITLCIVPLHWSGRLDDCPPTSIRVYCITVPNYHICLMVRVGLLKINQQ